MPRQLGFVHGMIAGAAILAAGWALAGAQRVVPANEPAAAAGTAQLIQARRLEIVDQTGTVLLALAADQNGGSVSIRDRLGRTAILADVNDIGGNLQLRDLQSNRPAAQLHAIKSGAELSLNDAAGRPAVRAAVTDDAARFVVSGSRGTPAIVLDRTDDDCGRLRTLRADGSVATELAHDAAQGGLIETFAAAGHRMVALSSTVGGHGRIDTFGPQSDNSLISLTATAGHEGQIYTYNAAGHMLCAIATRPAGPTLRLFNPHGEPIITLQCDEDGSGEIGVLNRDGEGRFVTP